MLRDSFLKSLTLFPEATSHREALHDALQTIRIRLIIVGSFFVLLFFLIVFRLSNLVLSKENSDSIIKEISAPAPMVLGRGDIKDRNGLVLATTLITNSLYADSRIIIDAEEAAEKLASVLSGFKKEYFLKKLTSGKSFVWLARHLTPHQKAKIINLGIPGIDFRNDEKRVYPYGNLFSHIVGFTDVDNLGISGVEKSFDEKLRKDGNVFSMSLDVGFQHILRDELENHINEFKADGGAGIIMNIKTGEILSIVSFPDFDPNFPEKNSSKKMFNQSTLGVYEMGSTMKVINTAMSLESGLVDLKSKFDASKPLKIGRFTVTDYRGKNRSLDVSEIFKYSSNIGSAKMALLVGTKRQKNFMNKLGLFDKIKLEIPENGTPKNPKKWGDVHTITASYGYGLSMTPLHIVRAISGIVNDGMMVYPTLLKVDDDNKVINKRVVSPITSNQIKKLMRTVITEGSGKKANVLGFNVMGKTGTVNLRKSKGRGYQKRYVRTSFIGLFPKKPKYAVWVMLDSPKGLKKTFGFNASGWNAAPLGGKVIERLTSLIGMVPELDSEDYDNYKTVTFRH